MMLRPWWFPEGSEEVEQVLGLTHFARKPVCPEASQRDLLASRRRPRFYATPRSMRVRNRSTSARRYTR